MVRSVVVDSVTLPWPTFAESAGCAALEASGVTTGPGHCMHLVEVSVLVRYPRSRDVWLVFLCSRHGAQVAGSAPLDEPAAAELAERRAQHDLALAGKSFRRPRPLRPARPVGTERVTGRHLRRP